MYRIRLPEKPEAEIAYSLYRTPARCRSQINDGPPPTRLICFLNNLLMPASSWETPISLLNQQRTPPGNDHQNATIPILTYDRFGQGATTDRDPLDSRTGAEPGYGHDFADVVSDLHSLIRSLAPTLQPSPNPQSPAIELLLIGASIGAPIARLYASTHPRTVSGLILLDSNIANRNYSDFWPDPHAPGFNPDAVTAPDCTLPQYIAATQTLAAIFDLDVKNKEHLDRRTGPALLPHADRPWLEAPGGGRAKVMVVGHDPETFAEDGLAKMGTPKSFTRRWTQTAWDEYNRGLLEIGDGDGLGGKAVRIAPGTTHFIQRDNPQFVADAVGEMLDVLGW